MEYQISSDSLEEVGQELEQLGIVGSSEWREEIEVLQAVLDGCRKAHERTNGRGNQQGVIAEYAGLDDEYRSHEIGWMLDALRAFGHVEQDGRRYRLSRDDG